MTPKLAIGIPCHDRIHADFAMSLVYASLHFHVHFPAQLAIFASAGSVIAMNRNQLVKMAREQRASHLLQIDSDLGFPADAATRLFRLALRYDLDVIGACYRQRTKPHNMIGLAMPNGLRFAVTDMSSESEIEEAMRLPAGMLMIRMRVFDKLTRPYFRHETIEPDGDVDDPHQEIGGEDYYFCDSARAAGFRLWHDPLLSLSLAHLSTIGIRMTAAEPGFEYVPR